jgi:hypothetical protein
MAPGFGVKGSGFRIHNLECEVQGLGCRVHGYRIMGSQGIGFTGLEVVEKHVAAVDIIRIIYKKKNKKKTKHCVLYAVRALCPKELKDPSSRRRRFVSVFSE